MHRRKNPPLRFGFPESGHGRKAGLHRHPASGRFDRGVGRKLCGYGSQTAAGISRKRKYSPQRQLPGLRYGCVHGRK